MMFITDVRRLLRTLAARVRRARNPVLARPLDECSDALLDASLAKAGLSRDQLFTPQKAIASHRTRMAGMMATLGVDAGQVVRNHWPALKQADANCAGCTQTGRCERWLAWGRPNAGPEIFCPNASFFVPIAAEQKKIRSARPSR